MFPRYKLEAGGGDGGGGIGDGGGGIGDCAGGGISSLHAFAY